MNSTQRLIIIASLLINSTLAGCSPSTDSSLEQATIEPSQAPVVQESEATPLSDTEVSEEFLISEEGIGDAKLGMTWGEFQQTVGTQFDFQETRLLVDFDGMAVLKDGKVQYYIVYPSGTNLTDSTSITMLYTDNPKYRTEAEVGVGTSLEDASKIYGQPTLSYNTDNESREFLEFANYNPNNILFRSNVGKLGEFAGIYSESESSYHETQRFREGSAIAAMMVLDGS